MVAYSRFLASDAKVLKHDVLAHVIVVSTVFTSVDYLSPPRLWETMIFGGPHDCYRVRYTSREAALAGHEKAVVIASAKIGGDRQGLPTCAELFKVLSNARLGSGVFCMLGGKVMP